MVRKTGLRVEFAFHEDEQCNIRTNCFANFAEIVEIVRAEFIDTILYFPYYKLSVDKAHNVQFAPRLFPFLMIWTKNFEIGLPKKASFALEE